MLNKPETIKRAESAATVGWWIVGLTAVSMGVLLWLSPLGDLREELGYALRISARFAFFALLLAYIARPWQ